MGLFFPLNNGVGRSVTYEEVNTFADLPTAADHNTEIYYVRNSSNTFWVNRRTRGFYRSNGTNWLTFDNPEAIIQSARSVGTTAGAATTIGNTTYDTVLAGTVVVSSVAAGSSLAINADREIVAGTAGGAATDALPSTWSSSNNATRLEIHSRLNDAIKNGTVSTGTNTAVARAYGFWWRRQIIYSSNVFTSFNWSQGSTAATLEASPTWTFRFKTVINRDSAGDFDFWSTSLTE